MSKATLDIVRAMAVMAWSDGRLDKKEMEKLRVLGKRLGLDVSERSRMEGFLRSRPSLDGIDFQALNDKEKSAMFMMAVHYAFMDGRVKPGEKKVLDQLSQMLGITPEQRAAIEQQVKDQKK